MPTLKQGATQVITIEQTPGPHGPSTRALAAMVVACWALFVGINAASFELFPQTAADLPRRGPDLLIEPAAGAFAIWSLIFTSLGAGALYQALPQAQRRMNLASARLPLAVSFALGALWPVAIGYNRTVLGTLLLFGMLGSAAVAYKRIDENEATPSWAERVLLRWPLSLYLGWLSLAGIVSLALVLTSDLGIPVDALGIPHLVWAVIAIGLAAACGIVLGFARQDWAYNSAIAWGLGGIAVEQQSPALTSAIGLALVAMAAGLGIGYWRLHQRR